MTEIVYPSVFERIKATMIDTFSLVLFMVGFGFIFSLFESVPDTLRMIAFICVFFLYEPIFISLMGATIGHSTVGIEVKKQSDESQKINFFLAIVRFVIKSSLGWVSLLTVSSSEKKLAIHDKFARSVVVFKKTE